MNRWFKKAPYLGWIVCALTFLITTIVLYHKERDNNTPKAYSKTVQENFKTRLTKLENDAASGVFSNLSNSSADQLSTDAYYLFVIKDATSVYWNAIDVVLPLQIKTQVANYQKGKIEKLSKGFFFLKSWKTKQGDGYVLGIVPVFFEYPIENEYFKAHFVANSRIPVSTVVSAEPSELAMPIFDNDNNTAFYLTFTQKVDDYFKIGWSVWLFTVLFLLSVFVWIHEFCYGVGMRLNNGLYGWCALFVILIILRLCYQFIPLPLGYLNTEIFSPELYSSSFGIDSFVSFIVNQFLVTWLVFYFASYAPLHTFLAKSNNWLRLLLKLGVVFGLTWVIYFFLGLSLISINTDSKISFFISNLYSINAYTIIGVFCIIFLTVNIILIVIHISFILKSIASKRIVGYAIMVAVCIVFHLIAKNYFPVYADAPLHLYLVTLGIAISFAMIALFGVPFRNFMLRANYSTKTYVWIISICSFVAVELFYFNNLKEKELRKAFATRLWQVEDALIEYQLNEIGTMIATDSNVYNALSKDGNKEVAEQYIFYKYFENLREKFSINIDLRNSEGIPFQRKDGTLNAVDIALGKKGDGFPYIGFLNIEPFKIKNLLYNYTTPVFAAGKKAPLGYVTIGLGVDKRPKTNFQNSFLDARYNETDRQFFKHYSFAIYRNGRLWSQGGNLLFPFSMLQPAYNPNTDFRFKNNNVYSSELNYSPSASEYIRVIYKRNLIINLMSLFSLVLFEMVVVMLILVLLHYLIFYPREIKSVFKSFKLTIRFKINFTILITVFGALVAVGIITVTFLINRYRQSQELTLQSLLLYYSQDIQHFTSERSINLPTLDKDFFSPYSDLSFRLHTLAKEQGLDVNLYNRKGKLVATSQLELYNKGLLSINMQPSALKILDREKLAKLALNDKIGDLTYQNIYTTIRDDENKVVAYLNLPYYASKSDINDEISNIVLLIVNVYSFVFFISVFAALFISNNIVNSFKLLIQQFRNIRLKHNEYLEWPHNDEIGLLVREYNLMIGKVESMAAKLTQTEREATWREIAKQIAHEIKNPLTPMKLNIQYLQQAIVNGRDDISDLAARVSKTLVEQIENLNYIANEFSNFAKLPESNPQPLNLVTLLQSLVEMYQKDEKVQLGFYANKAEYNVFVDKSHALRVFTNLILNAIQATEETENAQVSVVIAEEENWVTVSVIDNGAGIPEELQERLFLPYFTTKSSGTGLGLSMTKNMVEHANGSIWFETENKKGTTFFVKLPLYI